MAWAQTTFFGLDLKFGVWIYGLIMLSMSVYYILTPTLSVQDWIAFIGITTPASTFLVLTLIDSQNFGYAWANWYFSAFAFILATIYAVMQTLLLLKLKESIGDGAIQFRIAETGNPLAPRLIG